MTMPILEGLDGVNKMSKSLGNYIGINEEPEEMFGKIMSISDVLMWRYFELLSFRSMAEINNWRSLCEAGAENPKNIKIKLASEIVERFSNPEAAEKARSAFEARFKHGQIPDNIEKKTIAADAGLLIANAMKEAGLTSSTSESYRMIKQGAVRVDNNKISDKQMLLEKGKEYLVQVGKRKFSKITIT